MRRTIITVAALAVIAGVSACGKSAAAPAPSPSTHVCAVYVGPGQPEFPDGYAYRDFPANVPCP